MSSASSPGYSPSLAAAISSSSSSSSSHSERHRRPLPPPQPPLPVAEPSVQEISEPATEEVQSPVVVSRRAPIKCRDISSSLSFIDLELIRREYEIPSDFVLSLPPSGARAFSDVGPNKIILYEEDLKAGVRLPFSPFLVGVSNLLGVPLSQFHPNGLRFVVGVGILLRVHDLPLNPSFIPSMYKMSLPSRESHMTVSARAGCGIFTGQSTSLKDWKDRFFVVETTQPWSIPTHWSDKLNEDARSGSGAELAKGLQALKTLQPLNILDLISEHISRVTGR